MGEIAEASSLAQAEQLKRKESEIVRLKRQIEELQKEQTQVIGDMRKKHRETLDDFGDQLEQMQKAKTKVDREKTKTQQEMDELTTELDIAVKARNTYEGDVRMLQGVVSELKLKMEQQQNDFNNERKNRSAQHEEVLTLNNKISSLENRCEELTFTKLTLEKECQEMKIHIDDSSKDRSNLTTYVSDLSRELIGLKDRLDDESESKIDLQQHHSNVITENQKLRSEIDRLKKDHDQEIEIQRKKLMQKIQEAEEGRSRRHLRWARPNAPDKRRRRKLTRLSWKWTKPTRSFSSMKRKYSPRTKKLKECDCANRSFKRTSNL